ncbi:MAG: hypothetical protein ACPGYV_04710 [Phycisphaeraceae bacterium]
MYRYGLFIALFLAWPMWAAPEFSEADRQRLADGTTDRDANLDEQDGFYVLMRNASTWQGDDFSGDAGAAVAPLPDYAFLGSKSEQARGNVYLVEGWLAGADRWPTAENHSRDALFRAGHPDWGDRVTRWTIATQKGNADATVLVLFNDPNARIKPPARGSRVRVAGRFYKLWTIDSAEGTRFTYPVFVAGAYEVVEAGEAAGSGGFSMQAALFSIAGVVAVFFIIRWMMTRMQGGGGQRTREYIDARRREREERGGGDEDDEAIDDLPDDPVAALDVLRQKHETQ